MSEHRAPVLTYRIEYLCDRCRTPAVYTEIRRTTGFLGEEARLRYQHRCPECAWNGWLDYIYPRFEYKEINSGNF